MTVARRSSTLFPYRGKWRVTYVDALGNERSKTVATKQEGYRFIAGLSDEPTTVPGKGTNTPTLEEWVRLWNEERVGHLRIKTVRNNRSLIARHVYPVLGHLRMDKVSVTEIERLYRSLIEQKGLAPSSVQRIHAALTVPFHGAVREGVISVNPMSLVVKPRAPKPRIQALSAPQRQALWDVVHDLPAGEQLRWVLAVKFGLRQGEALGLRVEDCDPELKVLSIRRQLQRVPYEGWAFTPPKSAQGLRDIPLDDHTTNLFVEAVRGLPGGCELVFPNPDGKPQHSSTDRKAWLRLLKKAGIPAVSLHTARHTAATVMITSGVDVKTVQMVLGHSTPAFTLATCVHPAIDDLRRSLARIF